MVIVIEPNLSKNHSKPLVDISHSPLVPNPQCTNHNHEMTYTINDDDIMRIYIIKNSTMFVLMRSNSKPFICFPYQIILGLQPNLMNHQHSPSD